MCGIAGFVTSGRDEELKPALRKAISTLRHRGPDGEGYYFSSGAGLGHARLAIIDLNTGDQPLYNEDCSLVTVVNGEFYNYRELSQNLRGSGHRLYTKSDSETILHLYEDYPLEQCFSQINGMWALALWDERRRRLVLSRDRAGKKPLYYAMIEGGIVFGSEIKALLTFPGLDRSIDENALALYLRYGYVPSSYSIYRQIRKLPPASYAVFENGRLSIHSYWTLPEAVDHLRTLPEWLEELDYLFKDSVRLRLISDVPLGVFLSGGLDSSLIASQVVALSNNSVRTFSIGFDDRSYDETEMAGTMADHLHTDHHIERVTFDVLGQLPRLAAHFDEPFADTSYLPTWHLCQATRKHVTVALSGDGGDELFGGYRRYMAGKFNSSYFRVPRSLRQLIVEPLVNMLPAPAGYYGKSFAKKAKLFVSAAKRLEDNPSAVAPRIFSDEEIVRLFPGLVLPDASLDPVLAAGAGWARSLPETMFRCDFKTYLADDILVKVDRMSMFHGLEVRCPFLDYRIVELAHRMPLKYKINGLTSKYILRRLARGRLPDTIINRSKQGFMLPLDAWFRAELKHYIREVLADTSGAWEISAAMQIYDGHQSCRQDNATKLWALAVLAGWYSGVVFTD